MSYTAQRDVRLSRVAKRLKRNKGPQRPSERKVTEAQAWRHAWEQGKIAIFEVPQGLRSQIVI